MGFLPAERVRSQPRERAMSACAPLDRPGRARRTSGLCQCRPPVRAPRLEYQPRRRQQPLAPSRRAAPPRQPHCAGDARPNGRPLRPSASESRRSLVQRPLTPVATGQLLARHERPSPDRRTRALPDRLPRPSSAIQLAPEADTHSLAAMPCEAPWRVNRPNDAPTIEPDRSSLHLGPCRTTSATGGPL